MDGIERNPVFPCSLLHLWHPIIGVGALVGIVEDKAVFLHLGMLGTVLEFWRPGILCKGQIHEVDAAIGDVRNLKALMVQKLWVSKEFSFAPLCTQNTNAVFALRLGIPKAFFQQLAGIAVPFQGAGDPQTVDIKPACRFNGHPCVFCRDVLDKAFAALCTAVKNKPLLKSLLKPFLLGKALFAGHGTTDVFLVDVFFCDSDILHRSVPLYPYAFSDTATFLFLAAAYRIRPSPPIKAVISSR